MCIEGQIKLARVGACMAKGGMYGERGHYGEGGHVWQRGGACFIIYYVA